MRQFKIGDFVSSPYGDGTIDDLPVADMAWVQIVTDFSRFKRGVNLKDLKLLQTGSVKKDEGKYDPTMLTIEMVELVSRVRMFGAKKYARGNFKITGFKYTRSLAAALRHIFSYLSGEDLDPESGLSHLGHAICCLEHCIYDSYHHPENDDRKD